MVRIIDFYIERNGNTKYSTKVLDRVEKSINLLIAYPELGHLTENKETRVIVKDDFLIFYEVSKHYIEVVSFWDGRQNPKYRIDN
ncbi:MAG: type II toxin-antitoxin system RelE/ParE family toxin [Flammeovirgaceae bacterium]